MIKKISHSPRAFFVVEISRSLHTFFFIFGNEKKKQFTILLIKKIIK